MKDIRFIENFTDEHREFITGELFEYHDYYIGEYFDPCLQCNINPMKIYRVKIDDLMHHIPEIFVVPLSMPNEKDRLSHTEGGFEQNWVNYVTTDEIERLGRNDYVKAAKEFLKIDISAKKRIDQADYSREGRYHQIQRAIQSGEVP